MAGKLPACLQLILIKLNTKDGALYFMKTKVYTLQTDMFPESEKKQTNRQTKTKTKSRQPQIEEIASDK